jgi:hypothetical protein
VIETIVGCQQSPQAEDVRTTIYGALEDAANDPADKVPLA